MEDDEEDNGAEDVVDVRENEDLEAEEEEEIEIDNGYEPENLDQFEKQFEEFVNKHNWPINQQEPGFPQVLENMDQFEELAQKEAQEKALAQEKVQQINVIPGLQLFAQRRRQQPEVAEAEANPQIVKMFFNKWPEKQQNKYIQQIRDLFPEFEAFVEPLEEDFGGEQRRRHRQRVLAQQQREEQQREELRRNDEERQEYIEKIKEIQKKNRTEKRDQNILLKDLLKRGIKNNAEEEELRNLKYMMSGTYERKVISAKKPNYLTSVLPSKGTAHLEDLDFKLLKLLFKKFTFQGLLVLSQLTPKWEHMFKSLIKSHTILWFCNEEQDSRRFLPIEDCCLECHYIMDFHPVIRIFKHNLIPVITDVLSMTKHLKCLRLYRFQMNKILIVKNLYQRCPQIQHFDLTECSDFTLIFIKELCFCYPKLKHLILTATNLKEEMLAHIIKKMIHLVTLVVSSTLITGESLQSLPSSLKRLDIRCCPQMKISELIKFFKYSGDIKLQHLKIDSYRSKDIYHLIWKFFKQSLILLEVMDTLKDPLNGQSYLTEMPLMKTMEALKVGKNVVFEARVFDNIINSCPNMRSFSMFFEIKDVFRFSEENLLQITHKWILLERLELISCPIVGKPFIESLQRLNKLKYLNLTESPKLTDEFMTELLPKLSALNFLVLDKCLDLGKQTIESAILKAKQMSPELFRMSMIRCNFQSLPYLKGKYLPQNLRITYSSIFGRRYVTFDGHRTKFGNISQISEFLNGK